MSRALDASPLFAALHRAGIEHIVVGGYAVVAHGHVRTTKDLAIVPNPDEDNLRRLASWLSKVGARIVDSEDFDLDEFPADPTTIAGLTAGGNWRLETPLGTLDLLRYLVGAPDPLYGGLARSVVRAEVEGVPVVICGLADLRRMKEVAGRPQDLIDLEHLPEA